MGIYILRETEIEEAVWLRHRNYGHG